MTRLDLIRELLAVTIGLFSLALFASSPLVAWLLWDGLVRLAKSWP